MLYEKYLRPTLFEHDSEEIHDRVLKELGRVGNIPGVRNIIKAACTVRDKRLEQSLFGLTFPNPVGLAAGMDKNAVALTAFEMLGFGSVEYGGVTAVKQDGNAKPRLFRVPGDEALINRMGFNNDGAEAIAYHLRSARKPAVPVGANIGKSAKVPVDDMEAVVADYCFTLRTLYPYADFFVINVSSPNTLNLRLLQGKEFLEILLTGIKKANLKEAAERSWRPRPILLKISPDLSFEELDDVCDAVRTLQINGIVATNTTVKNDGFRTTDGVLKETGGRSGTPLHQRAVEVVRYIHRRLPALPLIGVGGISCGEDAHRMILAGASLVQVYTGLVYKGPGLAREINADLLPRMERDGVRSMTDWHPDVYRG